MNTPARGADRGSDRRRDGARGCLLGASCGDELGAAFEGTPRVDAASLDAWLAASEPVRATDDTVMMRVLARHLTSTVACGRDLDEDDLMQAFLRAFRDDPGRGYGPGTARLFEQVFRGKPWREASAGQFSGAGSLGNGGAMRVAPVGLLPLPLPEVAQLAGRSAAVTHAHPLGTAGAALQACAVALAFRNRPGEAFDREAYLTELSRQVPGGDYADRLERIRELPYGSSAEDAAARTGNDITALSAVPAAVAAFVSCPDSPARAIRFAIGMGGDTDTIATMAGAIAGARAGESALPVGWLRRLEDPGGLRELADELVADPSA